MILQALVKLYEDLAAQDKVPKLGWGLQKISYALEIEEDGIPVQVICLRSEETRGKKTVTVPQLMELPAGVKRAVNISSNFLWDNAAYLLGIDGKGKPERALQCFRACAELHRTLLSGCTSPAASALLRFFDAWKPEEAEEHPLLSDCMEELKAGANLVFRFRGAYIHEDSEVRAAWQNAFGEQAEDEKITCLVTGRESSLAVLHPSIKGISGAQSSGASLVSFNAPSFCSYNREQGANAPTSQYAAFAYGTALNYLIADREHTFRIGDTTVLCWADGGEEEYQGLIGCTLFGADSGYSQDDVAAIVKGLIQGQPKEFDSALLNPDTPFYILGISPNAARLSVRFFLKNSFGAFLKNVQEHQERLKICRSSRDTFETIPLWVLLNETVNQNSRDKSPSPELAGEMLRAVLSNTRYPATLLNGITLRIRADHEINRSRAATIKAYYLKNKHPAVREEEVLTVSLNPESTSVPYQLGRVFFLLENIQYEASGELNSTIADKYFNSASATPAVIFPILLNLAHKHLRKLGGGKKVYLEKKLQAVLDKIPDFPDRLSLPEQGAFQLGYYHQKQAHFAGFTKEEM